MASEREAAKAALEAAVARARAEGHAMLAMHEQAAEEAASSARLAAEQALQAAVTAAVEAAREDEARWLLCKMAERSTRSAVACASECGLSISRCASDCGRSTSRCLAGGLQAIGAGLMSVGRCVKGVVSCPCWCPIACLECCRQLADESKRYETFERERYERLAGKSPGAVPGAVSGAVPGADAAERHGESPDAVVGEQEGASLTSPSAHRPAASPSHGEQASPGARADASRHVASATAGASSMLVLD